MSDVTASDDAQSSVAYDPPGCYFEGGSLKFNMGSNTGPCTASDQCVCYVACAACAAGQFQDEPGKTECKGTPCVAGRYFEHTAQKKAVVCKACATGKFLNQTAQTACHECHAGSFQDLEGQVSCKCPAGYYYAAAELKRAGSCGARAITTLAQCSTAAAALGLPDVNASDDMQPLNSYSPSHCYFQDYSKALTFCLLYTSEAADE